LVEGGDGVEERIGKGERRKGKKGLMMSDRWWE